MKSPLVIRTITGILFILIMLGCFFFPSFYVFILFGGISLVGLYENFRMMAPLSYSPQRRVSYLFTTLFFISAYIIFNYCNSQVGILIGLIILFFLMVPTCELYRKKETVYQNIGLTYLGMIWIVFPFLWSAILTLLPGGAVLLLSILIILWSSDTLAYVFGSLFGKRKLFERVSPKKSWEGFLLSLVTTSLLSPLLYKIPYFQTGSIQHPLLWILFSVIIIVSGTFGDLAQSLLKRAVNVKDSGKILPGHGGILDRFDSFLFALPIGTIIWILL